MADEQIESYTIHLPAAGAKLIGGALQVEVTRDEVLALLVDGFLPQVALTDQPERHRSGFQDFGLPFAADAAITPLPGLVLDCPSAHRCRFAAGRGGGPGRPRPGPARRGAAQRRLLCLVGAPRSTDRRGAVVVPGRRGVVPAGARQPAARSGRGPRGCLLRHGPTGRRHRGLRNLGPEATTWAWRAPRPARSA